MKEWFKQLGAKLAAVPHASADGLVNASRDPIKLSKTIVVAAIVADLILRGRLHVIETITGIIGRTADYIVESSVKSGLALVIVIGILAFWHITVVNGRK